MIEPPKPDYRVGIGTDIHRLAAGRKLMLGGVLISSEMGLLGHSDGDVALHAIIDALLGAAGMGDIGTLFPDTDPKYKDADSKGLVLDVREKLTEKRWEIVNVDLTIHAERPRLEKFKGQKRGEILNTSTECVWQQGASEAQCQCLKAVFQMIHIYIG